MILLQKNAIGLMEMSSLSTPLGSQLAPHSFSLGLMSVVSLFCSFGSELMGGLSACASRLKAGSIVITLTKGLESNDFELLSRKKYTMSWGVSHPRCLDLTVHACFLLQVERPRMCNGVNQQTTTTHPRPS